MKQLSILIIFISLFSCKKEVEVKDSYEIQVNAPGIYNGMRAYLKAPDERGRMVDRDTAIVMDEQFSFTGKQSEPTIEYLYINGYEGFLPLIVENGDIQITINKDSLGTSEIKGTTNNIEYRNYFLKEKVLLDKVEKLTLDYRRANSEEKRALYNEMNQINTQQKDLIIQYSKDNPNSFVSVLLLNEALKKPDLQLENLEMAYYNISEDLKNTSQGQNIASYIETQKQILEAQKATQIGGIAPNFSAPTPDGKMLALNDIKGKVTIIDFWASWCGPCRRENPNVVNVYNKFHNKGLEIISVSLDRANQKERWLKAIDDDNLTWHHISNLQFWQDPIAKMYNVRSIPATFILDEEGKIIAKNLRGPALGAKMKELFN